MSHQTNVSTVGREQAITGRAAGVPFVALPPPKGARTSAPLVLAWHLLDAPRTEFAFAAALPLEGLDAWRVYLGLPLCGSRLPAGGFDELQQRAADDAVRRLYQPIIEGAVEELPATLSALTDQLEVEPGRVGLLGGSAGAAVVQQALVQTRVDADAAVLVSPLIQVRSAVELGVRQYGATYRWTAESLAVAARLDFVARAHELAAAGAPVLLVVGADDEPEFRHPAAALHEELRERAVTTALEIVPAMAHALADEPGTEAADQLPHAAAVDRLAVDWLQRHLVRRPAA